MATSISCRVMLVVKRYDVSTRVLAVSSTLARSTKYRNETWCRRWWHVSQRGLSVTSSSFRPSISTMLRKDVQESRGSSRNAVKSMRSKKEMTEKNFLSDNYSNSGGNSNSATELNAPVTVTYHRGLPRITLPLPSRREHCMFTLKPITHTVGDFLEMLKSEDRGIDRAVVTTIDGVRIGSSNTIENLLQENFKLIINDVEYTVRPPLDQKYTMEDMKKLSDVQTLVGQLYEAFHVREYQLDMERQIVAELESVKLELEPLEQQLQEIESVAERRANIFIWACLVMMCMQFGGLARLTWWEYSWDIMEPITYFVTYGTAICWLIYFLLTKQEYMLQDVLNRRHLIVLHKRAKKAGFDLDTYNRLKDRSYELETALKIIRGPLYEHKVQVEQRRERRSSSSSRSPSSSPSPSPSPSPERIIPKRGMHTKKIDESKEIPPGEDIKFS